MVYLIKFRSRFVKLATFNVKDIYMLYKECYAAWWLSDDKSQASISRDSLQDSQNIPGVAPEGLLNKLFYSSNITLMTMHTIDINVYHSDA